MKLLSLCAALLSSTLVFSQNAPIDFEPGGHGATWSWRVFENETNPPLAVVLNPDTTGINPSKNVARFEARQLGQPFAGVESTHGIDIGSWTITQSNAIIRIMVYKPNISDVGIKLVRFDNWSLGEIKVSNTRINEWEQLEFDFSAHIGNTYDQIVIFPDFTSRSENRIMYFDNVYGEMYVAPPPPPPTVDSAAVALPNFFSPNDDGANDTYQPDLQFADWASWKVYNRWGDLIFQTESLDEVWDGTSRGSKVAAGVYFIDAECGSNTVGNTARARGTVHVLY